MLEVSRLACSGQRLDTDMLEASSSIVKYFGLRAYRDRTVIKDQFNPGQNWQASSFTLGRLKDHEGQGHEAYFPKKSPSLSASSSRTDEKIRVKTAITMWSELNL